MQVLEAEKNGTKSMCCGAGGGRFWMEEDTGKNVNVERSQQLLATGASRIATACPFCYVMIDDGVKGEGVNEDEVKVADIAIHMLEALERGDALAERAALTPTIESPVTLTSSSAASTPAAVTAAAAAPVAVLEADPEPELVVEANPEPVPVVEAPEVEADPEPVVTEAAAAPAVGRVDSSETAEWRTVEADDLKVIKGIGPKLESLLHEIGIRTYEQIAAFPADYIAQLDDFLSFTGRIERDQWVSQAGEFAQTRPTKTGVLPPIPDETPDNATSQ